ncbi:hypothetical protein, unlikely [Trypanosoma brucei brucei TREU927]|uniref:Uncharacterized protein n=1 Tax=Trypanosoma brucei brucei (strain 927/4 GUTat10.1) TaxID=185431 RepID=Q4GY99_TRYB2|nr:hypothetical protein, unlikely [Trypanosoma brucei brucei TREU927]CAJ16685.1 hypothetical protein, unlikely [Trypanosoma brucei brucei TREU927]
MSALFKCTLLVVYRSFKVNIFPYLFLFHFSLVCPLIRCKSCFRRCSRCYYYYYLLQLPVIAIFVLPWSLDFGVHALISSRAVFSLTQFVCLSAISSICLFISASATAFAISILSFDLCRRELL